MGKNKLAKFAEMETFAHVFQCGAKNIGTGCDAEKMKGKWHASFFKNSNPIVVELGCGKGEYTVGLAEMYPEKNFIGIDIKGARMWSGARIAQERGLNNVAFLRTNIEVVATFFEQNEISEIWITFPDPQMKKVTKRLTSTYFMERYRTILIPNGTIHLKSDSHFLFTYTCEMVKENRLPVNHCTYDLYASELAGDRVFGIKTYYEQQWLSRGITIKYIQFALPSDSVLTEPEVEIEHDSYRSFGRNARVKT